MRNSDLKRRIIEISYPRKLSHLGSCLTMVDILEGVYSTKDANDLCILSAGHAGLALYVVLEKHFGYNAEYLFNTHGVHPNRDPEHGILCSSGSLGHCVGISVGFAIANPDTHVHCFTTDGEMAEGVVDEALRYVNRKSLKNFTLHINYNGFSAYQESSYPLVVGVDHHIYNTKPELGFLHGLDAHYHVMNEQDYKEAMEIYES